MTYETIIGLEVHVQLKTESKVYCGCSTNFGSPPNTQTCPVCLGFPGSLPVLNKKAFELACKVALALNCKISQQIRFDRKNYFYPDLPKNYQISQFAKPLGYDGLLDIFKDGTTKRIRIRRVHLEEDTGRLLHESLENFSLIDFNRSGIPLLEIVTEPDLDSPEEAVTYLASLKSILQYLEVSDCNMEEGSLRCDANISVRPQGQTELGTKTEIKNLNSFKNVKLALEFENKRQLNILKSGSRVIQETRLWNPEREITDSMRTKEEAHDYRYFPEPDLLPFDFEEANLEDIRKTIPELPDARRKRFIKEYGLSEYDAGVIIQEKTLADFFERCAALYERRKILANWLIVELLGILNQNNINIRELSLKESHLVDMLKMIDENIISGKIAKELLPEIIRTGRPPQELVSQRGLLQITDTEELERIIEQVISENPKAVEDFKKGKPRATMFLVGKVMEKTKGKANPKLVNEIIEKKLKEEI